MFKDNTVKHNPLHEQQSQYIVLYLVIYVMYFSLSRFM